MILGCIFLLAAYLTVSHYMIYIQGCRHEDNQVTRLHVNNVPTDKTVVPGPC